MLAELTQAVSRVEQNQLEIAQGQRNLGERIRVLSEQQATLIELLTPEGTVRKLGDGDGSGMTICAEAVWESMDGVGAAAGAAAGPDGL